MENLLLLTHAETYEPNAASARFPELVLGCLQGSFSSVHEMTAVTGK